MNAFEQAIQDSARLLERTSPLYTVSGEKDPARDYLSVDQALACLKIVEGYLGPDCEPKLYRDHEGPFWNISYEGGPEEWAYRITMDDTVTWPVGVYVECVAMSWCIGLHPALNAP